MNFKPSEYQQKIFDFIVHGNGNCVISAKAGSAKTTTCVECIKLIKPKYKTMFLAFNKSIAEELSEKLKDIKNVIVKTSHSLGYSIIRDNVDGDVELDEFKYSRYLKSNIETLANFHGVQPTIAEMYHYIQNVLSLVDFSRFNLAQTQQEVKAIAEKYSIPITANECEVVIKLMEWGKEVTNVVDYTDMVWIPVETSMDTSRFKKDFVFVDECQDQSLMSIELFLRCIKRGGRFICVGDEKQTIYTFCGSSEDAFKYIKEYPKTTLFELPICYRCPKSVIEFVNGLVPNIKPHSNAIVGEVVENYTINNLIDGDMVLCRSKAPLLKLYNKLLLSGKQCYIKGQEIGVNLKEMVNSTSSEELNTSLKQNGVFVELYDWLITMRNNFMESNGLDCEEATLSAYIMEKYDMLKALEVISYNVKTKSELLNKIDSIFNTQGSGVTLSTIHKAKGLESDNVYILCPSSLPSPLAKKDWEKDAEKNLMYVAYTRAKKRLGFISEDEVKPFGVSQSSSDILNDFGIIENLVCRVLGKEPIEKKESATMARFSLSHGLTEIKDITITENKVNINSHTVHKSDDLLSELDDLLCL